MTEFERELAIHKEHIVLRFEKESVPEREELKGFLEKWEYWVNENINDKKVMRSNWFSYSYGLKSVENNTYFLVLVMVIFFDSLEGVTSMKMNCISLVGPLLTLTVCQERNWEENEGFILPKKGLVSPC